MNLGRRQQKARIAGIDLAYMAITAAPTVMQPSTNRSQHCSTRERVSTYSEKATAKPVDCPGFAYGR